jgi:site-specific recombinase XerD
MPCIDKFHDVSAKNKQLILNFENNNRTNGRSEATIKNYSKLLCYYARHLGNTTFANATKQDVEDFFSTITYNPNSQDTMKIGLRFFYRWLNGLEKSDRLPECVRWLQTRSKKQIKRGTNPRQLKERVITEDEYTCLMEASRGDLQTQAMVEVLNYYGVRVSELLSMNTDCVEKIDIGTTIIVLNSKTEPRSATLLANEHRPTKLLTWIDEHPHRGEKDKPLWISTQSRTYHQRLSVSQAEVIISTLGERAGLRKHLKCHFFRHTSLTRDCANGMPWTFVASKYGLEKNSCMQSVYDHNDHDKFLEHYRAKQGIVREPTPNEIKNSYEARIKELEDKLNKVVDSEMFRGYLVQQQKQNEKDLIEAQQQAQQDLEAYRRGEL